MTHVDGRDPIRLAVHRGSNSRPGPRTRPGAGRIAGQQARSVSAAGLSGGGRFYVKQP